MSVSQSIGEPQGSQASPPNDQDISDPLPDDLPRIPLPQVDAFYHGDPNPWEDGGIFESDHYQDDLFHHDTGFMARLEVSAIKGQTVYDLQQLYEPELSFPVGCRLRHFWPRWVALGASTYAVHKLSKGIGVEWKEDPPPISSNPWITSDANKPVVHDRIKGSVMAMLDKQAIRPVYDGSPGFYSRLFMVPKKGTNKWRPVIDLSALNRYASVPHFKMETSEVIRASLASQEWTTSIDLQDAYFHLPIHQKFRKYFRFQFEGVCYEYLAVPFGLGSAPFEFSENAGEFKRIALVLGFRLNQYLDDWIDRCL